jgi:anhydro-N-acetylmuramic acid kinase
LDRNDFSLDLAGRMELADGARTLAAVTAAAILAAAGQMPERPALWIVSGGGARNPHILADLGAGAEREGARVATADALGLNGDSMEAEAWAYLAVRARAGLPITFPTTTGVPTAVGGGVLALPDKT